MGHRSPPVPHVLQHEPSAEVQLRARRWFRYGSHTTMAPLRAPQAVLSTTPSLVHVTRFVQAPFIAASHCPICEPGASRGGRCEWMLKTPWFTSHSKRSAALTTRNLELSLGSVMERSPPQTMSKGEERGELAETNATVLESRRTPAKIVENPRK